MGFAGHNRTKIHLGPAPIPEPGAPQREIDDDEPPIAANDAHSTETARTGSRLAAGDLVAGTKYRIVRFIGDGGMGEVYEAVHVDLERPVALKILLPTLTHSVRAVELFRSEARTVSRVGAEEIVQLFDFAELPDGRVMFTMELLEGPTVAELIHTERPSVGRIITILRQLCSGLGAAHAAGIVHRDIKPDNIVLDRRRKKETVKILDFGIATMLDGSSSSNPIPAGTPLYLAPELITHDDFDHRADIYSLGCVAYELCTGQAPFAYRPGETVSDVLRRQVHEAPPSIEDSYRDPDDEEEERPEIPAVFEAIIQRCLSKSPEHRYATVEELEAALCEAQIQLAMTTPWENLSTSTRGAFFDVQPSAAELSGIRPEKRRSLWPVVTALSVLIAAATVVWSAQRPEPAEAPEPVIVERQVPLAIPTPTPIVQAPREEPAQVEAVLEAATAPEPTPRERPRTPAVHKERHIAQPATETEEDAATDALLTGQKKAAELGLPNPADIRSEAVESEPAEPKPPSADALESNR